MRRLLIRILIESPLYFERKSVDRLQHLKFMESAYTKTIWRHSNFPPPAKRPPEAFPEGIWPELHKALIRKKKGGDERR